MEQNRNTNITSEADPADPYDSSFFLTEEDQRCAIEADDGTLPEDDLIGDYSRSFALPRMAGRQPDLPTISSTVLAHLISGTYNDQVASFRLIDCRYPYEYEGGHIKGAVNLYKYKHIFNLLNKPMMIDETKSNLLVFYCEFSSSRAPRRLRFLRKIDRENHEYPYLSYPECYILQGGYKAFFFQERELCEPQEYRLMKQPDCLELYCRYKEKTRDSKTKLFIKLGKPLEVRRSDIGGGSIRKSRII